MYETVNKISIVNRDLGLQTVNNGELTAGVYSVIEVNYKKNLMKKEENFPMSVIKSKHALKEMISMPKLLELYKCLERSCTKIFNNKDSFILHMKGHFSNPEKKKSKYFYLLSMKYVI